jgi:antitoxin component of RelBE/YafQ-DinJ toxin-antitoxin module
MGTQNEKKEYIHVRISKEIKNEYIKYCNENGFSLSKRIRQFIENELNNKINSNG